MIEPFTDLEKNNLKLILVKILIVFMSSAIYSQNISTDYLITVFDDLRAYYENTPNFTVQINHKSFKTKDDLTPYETTKGEYIKIGNDYYSSLLGYKTIQKGNIRLTINEQEKVIAISEAHSFNPKDFMSIDINEWIKVCEAVKHSEEANADKYTFFYKPGLQFKKSEITIDKKGWLSKLTIFYNRNIQQGKDKINIQPKLEISYNEFSTKTNASKINIQRYVMKQGKTYEVTSNYKQFKLLDTRVK
jgi:hypothetical protein